LAILAPKKKKKKKKSPKTRQKEQRTTLHPPPPTMLQRFVAAAGARPFSSSAARSAAGKGTPLSALDPPGYPTVEATYAKIASNLCVLTLARAPGRALAAWQRQCSTLAFPRRGAPRRATPPRFRRRCAQSSFRHTLFPAAGHGPFFPRLARAQDHRAQDAEEQAADAG
jgi:hypothetical protein